MTALAKTRGIHHLGLTVPNVEETKHFFIDTLNYTMLGERKDYPAVFVSDGTTTITLWQATDPQSATQFDRKNVIGLHHVALMIDSHQALEDLHDQLSGKENVVVEFPPQARGENGAHLMCTIPGGIRVEFISTGA